MEIKNSRRLTGTNLQGPGPSAIADVCFEADEDAAASLDLWLQALARMCSRFGLDHCESFQRTFEGGASIGFVAPIDQLYAATEMNEWAIEAANALRLGQPEPDLETAVEHITQSLEEELNPAVIALQRAADHKDCPFLWDDDEISLGYGRHSQVWPARSLPDPATIDWQRYRPIPVALVTGTNGKTTTSRMLTRIMKTAGFTVGSTSTDGVCIDERVVEEGDWTGTGAARLALRHTEVDAAVLETARGGLLRRGLAVERCDVAVVTNVAADHLGDYGIHDVEAMAQVKNLICAAVDQAGHRVINADDPRLTALLNQYDSPLILFGLDEANPVIQTHCSRGGEAWLLSDDHLVQRIGDDEHRLMAAADMPCAFGGAARHNISNALAASAAASSLGLPLDKVAEALSGFGAAPQDNPGRCQLLEVAGRRLLLDFGHNPHGLEAILGLAQSLLDQRPNSRLCVSLGQAGDRLDEEILDLAATLAAVQPDQVIIREMTGYERGRADLEVPHLIQAGLLSRGISAAQIKIVRDEVAALEAAMDCTQPGDLCMLLVHLEREQVAQWIEAQSP
ncbi:MAG: Mur ligase [Myxococcales bacterium]|nr:Mur ligase [Myxococcales bacterium]